MFNDSWMNVQGHAYEQIKIPIEFEPQEGDLLTYSREQFYRLLRNRGIRVLFYMEFETDECIINSTYGIRNMYSDGIGYFVHSNGIKYKQLCTWEGFTFNKNLC
ncbi:hypothetical protein PALU110988_29570 [Paenibacillus lupini]|uniref:hypothetical protein n=1 Tax=Paenibacillus lupini TaxID=1450204 RepID=UPI00141DE6F6|nr:hypothetical protein [Paenibacillus lupini]NIK21715.1 hypothetical protein [Paenibacillus lupini]